MLTGINESKLLTKGVSGEYKCKFDGRKWSLNQKWNNHKCRVSAKIQRNIMDAKNIILGTLAHVFMRSELCQSWIVINWKPLTISVKLFILDVWQGFEYACDNLFLFDFMNQLKNREQALNKQPVFSRTVALLH